MKTHITTDAMSLWEFQTLLETQIIPQEKEILRKEINSYRIKQAKTYA